VAGDSVDEGMQRYRRLHGTATTWETRERVVVAPHRGPRGETLIRRGARIAARATGGDLLAVHISAATAWPVPASPNWLSSGCSSSPWAAATLDHRDDVSTGPRLRRANNATQIVIGASRRKSTRRRHK